MLMRMFDPTASGINQIQTLSNGSVLLKCKTNEAVEQIEKKVQEEEGENFVTKERDCIERNRVKLTGMSKRYEPEQLISLIKQQHLSENSFVRVIKIYADKNTSEESFNAIMEFDAITAEMFVSAKKISVEWDMCKVFSYVRVNRCFKCLGFNHVAKMCKNKIACSKCGGEHKVEQCTSKEMSCVNCVKHAKDTGQNISTNHHAFAYKCWCTQQIMNKASETKTQ